MNITRTSENTLLILFEQHTDPHNFRHVRQANALITKVLNEYLVDIIPAYVSIQITFNVLKISGQEFEARLKYLLEKNDIPDIPDQSVKLIEIPVYYGPEVAFDLQDMAQQTALSTDEIIHIHSAKTYDVYAIGFAPGFAYLGYVDQRIAFPRKATPRKNVPQGSLGIADRQTAVYPADSPGGWQIIGRTPLSMIDYTNERLTPFATGDKVRFNPVSRSDYLNLGGTL